MGGFVHAGWKLDVEVFDGEFAGDEAGEKAISRCDEIFIFPREESFHPKLRVCDIRILIDERNGWQKEQVRVGLTAIKPWNGCIIVDEVHRTQKKIEKAVRQFRLYKIYRVDWKESAVRPIYAANISFSSNNKAGRFYKGLVVCADHAARSLSDLA